MKIITESEVEANLSMADCIAAMKEAMVAVSARRVHLPIRQFMPIGEAPGKMAMMPGVLGDSTHAPWCFGIKLVCKYQREPNCPYGTHVGMVLVFDAAKGVPLAMIEGSSLTAIRTAAASALATDLLARPGPARLLVLGNGEQAGRHVKAMSVVRELESITVWGRNKKRAARFAAELGRDIGMTIGAAGDLDTAVENADLICTTTSAQEPILSGERLRAGTHVNLVGSAIPTTAEADQSCVTRGRFFVDYRDAALAAAGELLRAIDAGAVTQDHIVGEIGEVAAGSCRGRQSDADITVYKSLGVSAQDLAAAHILYQRSLETGFGTKIELMDRSLHS